MSGKSNVKSNLTLTVIAAVFAALTAVMTAFLHIPSGVNGGYVHVGDAVIFLAASFLPTPYAVGAAAIGGGLADIISGAPLWAPFTVVIKALLALLISAKGEKMLSRRNMLMMIPCAAISIAGYYLASAIITVISGGAFSAGLIAAIGEIVGNFSQAIGSTVLYFVVAAVLDKTGFKRFYSSKLA